MCLGVPQVTVRFPSHHYFLEKIIFLCFHTSCSSILYSKNIGALVLLSVMYVHHKIIVMSWDYWNHRENGHDGWSRDKRDNWDNGRKKN